MANSSETRPMPRDRDDYSGRFSKSYTTGMAFDAVSNATPGATTSDVADVLGCSRRHALKLLRDLEENDRVTAHKTGNTFLWTVDDA